MKSWEGVSGKFYRVVGRAALPVYSAGGLGFTPVQYRNLPPFFAHPIAAKLCTLTDLKRRGTDGDPMLDLADVADLNEVLSIDYENEKRARKAAEVKNRPGPKR